MGGLGRGGEVVERRAPYWVHCWGVRTLAKNGKPWLLAGYKAWPGIAVCACFCLHLKHTHISFFLWPWAGGRGGS